MRVLIPGHLYALAHVDGDGETRLQFVQRAPHHPPMQGILCQELLRVLIDRVQGLEAEIPSPLNHEILLHLRQALGLFEARALLRKIEKGELLPEQLPVGTDGHFVLKEQL